MLGCVLVLILMFSNCDSRDDFPEDTIPDPPVVTISVEEDSLVVGDTLRVTVEATSELGLSMIWWNAEREDLGTLSNIHIKYSDSTNYDTATWEVIMHTALNFSIQANARDVEYGDGGPHQASDWGYLPFVWVYVTEE